MYVPVAVSCCVVPSARLGVSGVIAIDTNVADDTVRVVAEMTPPNVAVMVLVPAAAEVARPLEPTALLTVATEVVADAQVTEVVTSWVELSAYVPVAVNCCVVPSAISGFVGVTVVEINAAGDTVNVTGAEVMAPIAAVIPLVPAATGLTRPLEPVALLIVATEVVTDAQVTEVVTS